MRKITVQPEQLDACAGRMDQLNQDYVSSFNALFEAVDAMSQSWKGKDNIAFTTQIAQFQSDFRQLSVLCTQYADFVRNSAHAYRDTQDELTSQVSRLIR